ncbi:hypothetical protein TNCV_3462391 [Trichonephila clavipes]|nr:hypothetical protein TNCV_3462391 [Trichonephila clavipes]
MNEWRNGEYLGSLQSQVLGLKLDLTQNCTGLHRIGLPRTLAPSRCGGVRYATATYGEKSLENRGRETRKETEKEKKRDEREGRRRKKRRKESGERERGAGLGWRKGFSPRLEWKDDERRWR